MKLCEIKARVFIVNRATWGLEKINGAVPR